MVTAGTQTPSQQNTFIARNWRDLIRPRKLEVDPETLTPVYGKFTCEPLERGFGTTIGNGLRRVLLSSLQGAAIILNLKEVVVRSVDGKPRTLRVEKDGEGKVTAGDIQTPEGIEILNSD